MSHAMYADGSGMQRRSTALTVMRGGTEKVGDDGLTSTQRARYARAYRIGAGRGLTESNRRTIAALRSEKRA